LTTWGGFKKRIVTTLVGIIGIGGRGHHCWLCAGQPVSRVPGGVFHPWLHRSDHQRTLDRHPAI
jgi:hypothetical protein